MLDDCEYYPQDAADCEYCPQDAAERVSEAAIFLRLAPHPGPSPMEISTTDAFGSTKVLHRKAPEREEMCKRQRRSGSAELG